MDPQPGLREYSDIERDTGQTASDRYAGKSLFCYNIIIIVYFSKQTKPGPNG